MSDKLYAPLLAMVEAIEAEAERLLDSQAPVRQVLTAPRPSLSETMHFLERWLRSNYEDPSLTFMCDAFDGYQFAHRCKVCKRVHKLAVSEQELRRAEYDGRYAFFDLVCAKLDELYAQPCALELGHA